MQTRLEILQELERIKTIARPMGYEDVATVFDDKAVIVVLRKILVKEEEETKGA
jgi:hypothetical protein